MDDAEPAGDAQPAPRRGVQLGCGAMVLGIVLVALALVFRATSGLSSVTAWLGGGGMAIAAIGFLGLALAGLRITRRARRGFAAGLAGDFEHRPPDLAAVRALEYARLPATASQPRFPTAIVASLRVPARRRETFLVSNVPQVRVRPRSQQVIEPAASYQWTAAPGPLPQLLVTTDVRGQHALLGRDIDIENDDFNRRFRIDSSLPLTGKGANPQYAAFARYASAVLHPRAADCLTRLPANAFFAITAGYVGVITVAEADRASIERYADIIAEFTDLLPEHVVRRWAGSTDYLPTDNR